MTASCKRPIVSALGSELNDPTLAGVTVLGKTLYPGFMQSLEFLKKNGNLQTSFPDREKVWKIEINSGKNGKKSGIFFHSLTST